MKQRAAALAAITALALVVTGGSAVGRPSSIEHRLYFYPLSATSKRVVLVHAGGDTVTRMRFRGDTNGFVVQEVLAASVSRGAAPACTIVQTQDFALRPVPTLQCDLRLDKATLTVDLRTQKGGPATTGCYDLNGGKPEFGICMAELSGPPKPPPKPVKVTATMRDPSRTTTVLELVNREPAAVKRWEIRPVGFRIGKVLSLQVGGGRRLASASVDGVTVRGGKAFVSRAVPGHGGRARILFTRSGNGYYAALALTMSGRCPAARLDCTRETGAYDISRKYDLSIAVSPQQRSVRLADVVKDISATASSDAGLRVIVRNNGKRDSPIAEVELTVVSNSSGLVDIDALCPFNRTRFVRDLAPGAEEVCAIRFYSGHSKPIAGRIALKAAVAHPCSQAREESCANNDWPRGGGTPVILLVTG